MDITTKILARVDGKRLSKAVDGLTSGAYQIVVTSQSEGEIRGFVRNGDNKEYWVILIEGQGFCDCPDSTYRKTICKHAVALALYVIRTPQPTVSQHEAYC